jgi:hypothetical protein
MIMILHYLWIYWPENGILMTKCRRVLCRYWSVRRVKLIALDWMFKFASPPPYWSIDVCIPIEKEGLIGCLNTVASWSRMYCVTRHNMADKTTVSANVDYEWCSDFVLRMLCRLPSWSGLTRTSSRFILLVSRMPSFLPSHRCHRLHCNTLGSCLCPDLPFFLFLFALSSIALLCFILLCLVLS